MIYMALIIDIYIHVNRFSGSFVRYVYCNRFGGCCVVVFYAVVSSWGNCYAVLPLCLGLFCCVWWFYLVLLVVFLAVVVLSCLCFCACLFAVVVLFCVWWFDSSCVALLLCFCRFAVLIVSICLSLYPIGPYPPCDPTQPRPAGSSRPGQQGVLCLGWESRNHVWGRRSPRVQPHEPPPPEPAAGTLIQPGQAPCARSEHNGHVTLISRSYWPQS